MIVLEDWMIEGLQEALDHGGAGHNLPDVFRAVHEHRAQLWTSRDAVLVTEVNCAPNLKELHFWLATGTLDGAISLSSKVMQWGREMGCTVATLTGRRGWRKVLLDEGWHEHAVLMGRRL